MMVAPVSVLAAIAFATPIDRTSWFRADDYPAEAMMKGIEGSVTFEVEVDTDGKPASCHVLKSSGQVILDQKTCEIVLSRAHFKPALGKNGKPIAGRYSTNAIWKLSGTPIAGFHHAVLVDFSADVAHPKCRIESTLPAGTGPTCDQMLGTELPPQFRNRFLKVVVLLSAAPGDQQPYRGDPSWGPRLYYLATEQYHAVGGGRPIACTTVAAEGMAAGRDGCASFAGLKTISEQGKKETMKLRVEESMFAVMRPDKTRSNGCKTGETAAEALGCN